MKKAYIKPTAVRVANLSGIAQGCISYNKFCLRQGN